MKNINKFILGLMGICALTLGSCTDDVPSDNLGKSPAVEGEGVFFPKSMKTSYSLTDEDPDATATSGVIKLPIQRTAGDAAVTIELKAEMDAATASVFTVPGTVQFAEGKDTASVKIAYANAVRGTKYTLKLSFVDGTEYANSAQTIVAEYPPQEVWEVVTEKAVYIDQIFSMFGVSDVMFTDITVEKLKDKNKYRFLSVYDNYYFTGIGLPGVLPDDFELPYIILDGESYSKPAEGEETVAPENALWQIPRTYLGFSLSSTLDFKYAPEFLTFGSLAYNLSSSGKPLTEDDYALGSFNKKKQMFDLGVCFHQLTDVSFQPVEGFQLWLDKSKMEVVYDRDYAPWTLVEDARGTYVSGLLKDEFIVDMEQGTSAEGEDPIFHLVSVYEEGTNITFFYNKKTNTVRVPKKQKTGLSSYGNDVYMDAKKASYDSETKIYTFEVEFYLIDNETGKKSAILATTTEKFRAGYTGIAMDDLQTGKSITDYRGNWVAPFLNPKDGSTAQALVTVRPVEGENAVAIKGLSALEPAEYDDTVFADYDPQSGLLMLGAQDVTGAQGYDMILSMYDVNNPGSFELESYLIGGLTVDGILAFVNAPNNEIPINSVRYLALSDGAPIGWWNSYVPYAMEWSAYTSGKSTALMMSSKPALSPIGKATPKVAKDLRMTPIPVEAVKVERELFHPTVVSNFY